MVLIHVTWLCGYTSSLSDTAENFCEAQARVRQGSARDGQGWPLRRKASKLKPLPRAYIKVGWVTIGHPRVTRATVVHIGAMLGHLRVTIG